MLLELYPFVNLALAFSPFLFGGGQLEKCVLLLDGQDTFSPYLEKRAKWPFNRDLVISEVRILEDPR